MVKIMSPKRRPGERTGLARKLRRAIVLLTEVADALEADGGFSDTADGHFRLLGGGFLYAGRFYHLRPVAQRILRAFVAHRDHLLTMAELADSAGRALEPVSIRKRLSEIRRALRQALQDAGLPDDDPLPCVNHETYLPDYDRPDQQPHGSAWQLVFPPS
jgi:hypothetical protein